jgi:hypothetical protein
LEPPPEEQAGDEPQQHDQEFQAHHCHGDQHRPAFVGIEAEPLKPFRQPQQAFHDQKPDNEAIRREAIPAGFGKIVSHARIIAEARRRFGIPKNRL